MKTRNLDPVFRLLPILLMGLVCTEVNAEAAASVPAGDHSQAIKFQRPPLRFELNEGQTDPQVRFTARDRDGIAFLTSDGAVFQITKASGKSDFKPGLKKSVYNPEAGRFESAFVKMKTVGANPNPRVVGLDRLPGVTNYFLGNYPSKWRTNVPGYAKVKYESIYPGVDLIYYGNRDGHLEYDFIVAPGADPDLIALSIEDAQRVEVEPSGDLVISAATGTIRKPTPHVYQEFGGKRREIAAGYRLIDSANTRQSSLKQQRVAFALGAYDRSRPLVIDPQIIYATYLGGSSNSTIANEGARGVAVDAQGAVYITGVTQSADFPTKNPAQASLQGFANAFITKLDTSGHLVYSTYLGGSGFDEGMVIKVDDTGAAYIGGTTSSIDFPPMNSALPRGGRNDGFITKLSPSGAQIVFSTYLGGTDNDGVADLAIDAQKNVYIVGNVAPALGVPANDFPLVNPIQAMHGGGFRDGFMAKISASGSLLLFSTYLGGDGDDFFQSIRRDPTNGRVYLAFHTNSSNFPPAVAPSPGLSEISQADDASAGPYILGLNPFSDVSFLLAPTVRIVDDSDPIDSSDLKMVADLTIGAKIISGISRISVSGQKSTHAVEAQVGGGLDARLDLLDQNLNTTKTTFFGGSGEDTLNTLTTDALGGIYVVGRTRSANLPLVNPIQANLSAVNTYDGFLAVFQPKTLQPLFATYLGGTGLEESLNGVTVDAQGNIYVVGETFGNFPTTTSGALQPQLSGRTDAFIIKISPVTIPLPAAVDFDNDGKSDVGIYRDGTWVVIRSSDNGFTVESLGGSTHTPAPADYDGDGKTDIGVYLDGLWTIKRSSDGVTTSVGFGGPSFVPVPADYDGDGKADIAVYSNGVWSILRSSDGGNTVVAHGGPGWTPVPADYDGDGKTDIAVYINGAWSIIRSSDGGNTVAGHGGPTWIPLPADYDGDGRADVAVYTGGAWSIIRSSDSGNTVVGHGGPTWEPVPADYDGDGKTDISVHMSGAWSIIRSSNSTIQVVGHGGGPTDVPLN